MVPRFSMVTMFYLLFLVSGFGSCPRCNTLAAGGCSPGSLFSESITPIRTRPATFILSYILAPACDRGLMTPPAVDVLALSTAQRSTPDKKRKRSLSLSLSLSACVSVCVSLSFSFSLSLFLSHFSPFFSLFSLLFHLFSLSFFLLLFLSCSLSLSLSLFLSLSLSFSLFFSKEADESLMRK